eukprot:Trichotokara_eunicae@DN6371_c1_g2_i1.p1
MSVEGCGIKIVVDDTGISLNDSDPAEFSSGPYKTIQIVRDVTVLTVLFVRQTSEVAYSALVEPYDGDCQFKFTLPGTFSPFVAHKFGVIPEETTTVEETTTTEETTTVE